MAYRSSDAVWHGDLKHGKGEIKLGSGAFEGTYSFPSRFENGEGTNPEELIAAAHAGCFSMALAAALSQAGHPPTQIHSRATVNFGPVGGGFAITGIDLVTEAAVPGIDAAKFETVAQQAKENCPVSKALKTVAITLSAKLL
ncbi:MAG TPA: OsmC family protein [Dongiaceae bacterium]|nr:OsmC family protein [Dongiaceae bacterium]